MGIVLIICLHHVSTEGGLEIQKSQQTGDAAYRQLFCFDQIYECLEYDGERENSIAFQCVETKVNWKFRCEEKIDQEQIYQICRKRYPQTSRVNKTIFPCYYNSVYQF